MCAVKLECLVVVFENTRSFLNNFWEDRRWFLVFWCWLVWCFPLTEIGFWCLHGVVRISQFNWSVWLFYGWIGLVQSRWLKRMVIRTIVVTVWVYSSINLIHVFVSSIWRQLLQIVIQSHWRLIMTRWSVVVKRLLYVSQIVFFVQFVCFSPCCCVSIIFKWLNISITVASCWIVNKCLVLCCLLSLLN